ncbi:MAG: hypothetical protein WAN36_08465 [Calditrichia bacterium]
MNILILDELSLASAILSQKLADQYIIDVEEEYQSGKDSFAGSGYELVILGIKHLTPEVLDLVKILKEEPAAPGIIVFSYNKQKDERMALLDAGADFYFSHSWEIHRIPELVNVINFVYQNKRIPAGSDAGEDGIQKSGRRFVRANH